MTKRRPLRIKRKLYALLLLLLLLFLFELNRMLPGIWAGAGDSSGLREHTASLVGDRGVNPRPDDTGDTTGMRAPPEGRPPPDIPRNGAVIEVRLTDGTYLTDWSFGAGNASGTAPVPDPEHGRQRVSARQLREPIRVRTQDHSLEHHPLTAEARGGHWIVVVPETACSVGRRRTRADVRVLNNGEPVAEAEIRVSTREGEPLILATDAEGRVTISGLSALVRVARIVSRRVQAACWVAARGSDDIVLEVPPKRRRRVAVTGLDSIDKRSLTLATPDGLRLDTHLRRDVGAGPEAWVAADVPEDAPLLVIGRTQDGLEFVTPVIGVAARVDVKPPRILRVEITDEAGQPVEAASVVAHYNQSLGAGGNEPLPLRSFGRDSSVPGAVEITVPARLDVELLVARSGYVPASIPVAAAKDATTVPVTVSRGRTLDVRVLGADGSPAARAYIHATLGAGRGRVELEAQTDAEGIARLEGLAGTVAIFVDRIDAPVALLVVDVDEAEGPVEIRLEAAGQLDIVVADPNGVPLEDVRVDVAADDGGRPLVELPHDEADLFVGVDRTWVNETRSESPGARTNEVGAATIDRLPAGRTYRISLYKAGFVPQTIRKVEPGAHTFFATLVSK